MHQFSNMAESTLVYSTEVGRIKEQKQPVQRPKGDGVFASKNRPVVEKVRASQ